MQRLPIYYSMQIGGSQSRFGIGRRGGSGIVVKFTDFSKRSVTEA